MLSRLTLEQRLIAVNIALFLIAAVAALFLMAPKPTMPSPPDMEAIAAAIEQEGQGGQQTVQVKSYEKFGEKELFAMLVPFPTPSPTPKPTPVPPPLIGDALDWKLSGFGPNMVFVRDLKNNSDIIFDFDDPANSHVIRFQNQDMEIVLESIDDVNMTATFSYTHPQGKQTITKSFFDE